MALFKKSHSRGKPIVADASLTHGITYSEGEKRYTANLCLRGGPPYVYYELQITEGEMVYLATAWLNRFAMDRTTETRT